MSQLKVNSIIPTGGLSTGKFGGIIQVVPAFTTSGTTSTNTSPVDIQGLSVTITPSSTNSKFLIMACFSISHNATAGGIVLDLVRNGTGIAQGVNTTQGAHTSLFAFGGGNAEASNVFNYSYQHVDTTTLSDLSDITYKYTIQSVGSHTARVNQRSTGTDMTATGNLIVCEVSG